MTRRLVELLLGGFDARQREVPGRGQTDPYAILVAEIMAQQTRIDTVAPYHRRFCARFPDIRALAAAELDDVLKLWEGLGYYARARNLHATARQIVKAHAGRIPDQVEVLRTLPGIGPYTAGAVASIAFGHPEPAVDGNARRVLSRLFDIAKPTASRLDAAARELLASAPEGAGAVNQAIMDLGHLVCIPRQPDCDRCPVADACRARRRGTVADRPARKASTPKPDRRSAAALVWRNGSLLVLQRPAGGLLGGLWDLPSVDGIGPDHKAPTARALERSLEQTLGVSIRVGEEARELQHVFSHFRLRLRIYSAKWKSGDPMCAGKWQWASADKLGQLAFPIYLRRLLTELPAPEGVRDPLLADTKDTRGSKARPPHGATPGAPSRRPLESIPASGPRH